MENVTWLITQHYWNHIDEDSLVWQEEDLELPNTTEGAALRYCSIPDLFHRVQVSSISLPITI